MPEDYGCCNYQCNDVGYSLRINEPIDVEIALWKYARP